MSLQPPLYGEAPPLQCNRLMPPDHSHTTIDPPSGLPHCGKEATWHIMWTSDLENGLACDEHADEAREKWVFYAIHPYEMACSMVGIAVYSEPLNRCIIEEDGQTLEAKAMHEPLPVR